MNLTAVPRIDSLARLFAVLQRDFRRELRKTNTLQRFFQKSEAYKKDITPNDGVMSFIILLI